MRTVRQLRCPVLTSLQLAAAAAAPCFFPASSPSSGLSLAACLHFSRGGSPAATAASVFFSCCPGPLQKRLLPAPGLLLQFLDGDGMRGDGEGRTDIKTTTAAATTSTTATLCMQAASSYCVSPRLLLSYIILG